MSPLGRSLGRFALVWLACAVFLGGAGVRRLPTAAGQERAGPAPIVVEDAVGGSVTAVASDGDVAWVGVGHRLTSVDVSDPTLPEIGRSQPLRGAVAHLAVVGAYVLAVAEPGVLHVFDGTRPSDPTHVAQLALPLVNGAPVMPDGLVTDRSAAFVAADRDVFVVDLADSLRPQIASRYVMDGRAVIAVRDEKLYVAADPHGGDGPLLDIVDVHVLRQPRRLSRLVLRAPLLTPRSLAATDSHVFVAVDSRLIVVDVENAERPRKLSTVTFGDARYTHLLVDGSTLFAAASGRELALLDVSNPSLPTRVRDRVMHQPILGLARIGEHLMIASGSWGLSLQEAGSLQEVGTREGAFVTWADADGPTGMLVLRAAEYGVDRLAGVRLDTSSAAIAPETAWIDGMEHVTDVVVSGGLAIVAGGRGHLWAVDVADSLRPRVRSEVTAVEAPIGVAAADGVAVVLDEGAGIVVLDAGDPDDLRVTARFPTEGFGRSLAVSDGRAWGLAGGVVAVLDVSDVEHPILVARHELDCPDPWFCSMAVEGSTMVVFSGDESDGMEWRGRVTVYDVADPIAIRRTGSVDVGPFPDPPLEVGAVLEEGMAWLHASVNGLSSDRPPEIGYVTVVDVSTPGAPSTVAMSQVFDWTGDILPDGDEMWLAAGHGGLVRMGIDTEASPTPTPRPPTAAPTSGTGDHEVFLPHTPRGILRDSPSPAVTLSYVVGGAAPSLGHRAGHVYLAQGNRLSSITLRPGALRMFEFDGTSVRLPSPLESVVPVGDVVYGVMGVASSRGWGMGARANLSRLAVFETAPHGAPALRRTIQLQARVSGKPITLERAGTDAFLVLPVVLPDAERFEDTAGQLWLFDVSDPLEPRRAAVIEIGSPTAFLAQSDPYLFVSQTSADGTTSLKVLDAADPMSIRDIPTAGETVALPTAAEAVVVGTTLVVARSGATILVDVADPGHPAEIGVLERSWADVPPLTLYEPTALTAMDHGVVVGWYGNNFCDDPSKPLCGLTHYDLQNPRMPSATDWLSHDDYDCVAGAQMLAAGAQVVVARTMRGGFDVFDVNRSGRFVSKYTWGSVGEAAGVAAHDTSVATVGAGGLTLLKTAPDGRLSAVGQLDLRSSKPIDLRWQHPHLWITAENVAIGAVDVSDPSAPVRRFAQLDYASMANRRIAVGDRSAFVADLEEGLVMYDVTDPSAVSRLAVHEPGGGPHDVAWARRAGGSDLLAVAAGAMGLQLLDVSIAPVVTEEGRLLVDGDVVRIAPLEGTTRAIVASVVPGVHSPNVNLRRIRLLLVDTAQPSSPRILGVAELPVSEAIELVAQDRHAFLLDDRGQAFVVEVADTGRLDLVDIVVGDRPFEDIALAGSKLYSAMGYEGLSVWDIASAPPDGRSR